MKKFDFNFYLVSSLLLVISIVIITSPWSYMLDDTFFYYQTALNIVNGNGSTFNNIVNTNGYHPLWMGFVIISTIFSFGNKYLATQIGFFIQLALFCGIFYYCSKILDELNLKNKIIPALLMIFFFFVYSVVGSEGFINGFITAFTFYNVLKVYKKKIEINYIIFGLLFGFLFLARLDNIFGIVFLSLFLLKINYTTFKNFILTGMQLLIGFSIVAFPYLVYNYLEFGHLMPISGSIKNRFPEIFLHYRSIGKTGIAFILFSAFSIVYLLKKENDSSKKQFLILLSIAPTLNLFFTLLFSDGHSSWHWYYIWNFINISILSSYFYSRFEEKFSNIKYKTIIEKVVYILISVYIILLIKPQTFELEYFYYNPFKGRFDRNLRWELAISDWINNNLPPQTGIAVSDAPGMLAYFTEARIFPTDGLINDFSSQDSIAKIGMLPYWKSNNIEYFFGPNYEKSNYRLGYWNWIAGKDSIKYRFLSILHRVDKDTVLFTYKDRVLLTKDSIYSVNNVNWALWKIPFDRYINK